MQTVKDYIGFVAKDWIEGGAHPEYSSQEQWFTYLVLSFLCEIIYDKKFYKLTPNDFIDFTSVESMGEIWKNSKILELMSNPKVVSLRRISPDLDDSEVQDSTGLHIGWSLVEGHILNTHVHIVVFKGSNTATDLLIDLSLYESKDEHMSFHGGMYRALKLYEDKIIQSLLKTEPNGTRSRIYITGHSLGGAYANLLSLSKRYNQEILEAFKVDTQVVTFGSPMVVLGDCVLEYPHVDTTFTFAHENDLITKLPRFTRALIEQIKTHTTNLVNLSPIGKFDESISEEIIKTILNVKESLLNHCEKFQPYGQYHFISEKSHKLDPEHLALFHLNHHQNPLNYHKMTSYCDSMISLMEKKYPNFYQEYKMDNLVHPPPVSVKILDCRGSNGLDGRDGKNGHFQVVKLNSGTNGVRGTDAENGENGLNGSHAPNLQIEYIVSKFTFNSQEMPLDLNEKIRIDASGGKGGNGGNGGDGGRGGNGAPGKDGQNSENGGNGGNGGDAGFSGNGGNGGDAGNGSNVLFVSDNLSIFSLLNLKVDAGVPGQPGKGGVGFGGQGGSGGKGGAPIQKDDVWGRSGSSGHNGAPSNGLAGKIGRSSQPGTIKYRYHAQDKIIESDTIYSLKLKKLDVWNEDNQPKFDPNCIVNIKMTVENVGKLPFPDKNTKIELHNQEGWFPVNENFVFKNQIEPSETLETEPISIALNPFKFSGQNGNFEIVTKCVASVFILNQVFQSFEFELVIQPFVKISDLTLEKNLMVNKTSKVYFSLKNDGTTDVDGLQYRLVMDGKHDAPVSEEEIACIKAGETRNFAANIVMPDGDPYSKLTVSVDVYKNNGLYLFQETNVVRIPAYVPSNILFLSSSNMNEFSFKIIAALNELNQKPSFWDVEALGCLPTLLENCTMIVFSSLKDFQAMQGKILEEFVSKNDNSIVILENTNKDNILHRFGTNLVYSLKKEEFSDAFRIGEPTRESMAQKISVFQKEYETKHPTDFILMDSSFKPEAISSRGWTGSITYSYGTLNVLKSNISKSCKIIRCDPTKCDARKLISTALSLEMRLELLSDNTLDVKILQILMDSIHHEVSRGYSLHGETYLKKLMSFLEKNIKQKALSTMMSVVSTMITHAKGWMWNDNKVIRELNPMVEYISKVAKNSNLTLEKPVIDPKFSSTGVYLTDE